MCIGKCKYLGVKEDEDGYKKLHNGKQQRIRKSSSQNHHLGSPMAFHQSELQINLISVPWVRTFLSHKNSSKLDLSLISLVLNFVSWFIRSNTAFCSASEYVQTRSLMDDVVYKSWKFNSTSRIYSPIQDNYGVRDAIETWEIK